MTVPEQAANTHDFKHPQHNGKNTNDTPATDTDASSIPIVRLSLKSAANHIASRRNVSNLSAFHTHMDTG
jgi:hypothetical protein